MSCPSCKANDQHIYGLAVVCRQKIDHHWWRMNSLQCGKCGHWWKEPLWIDKEFTKRKTGGI